MTVNEFLSAAMVQYMQGGKGQQLEYVSRSECSQLGWYFWLKDAPGVYEMELKGFRPEMHTQGAGKEEFYVRYYPALNEAVLEDYSVKEQLARFDTGIFDDSAITTDMEEHEICPCCAVPQKDSGHAAHGPEPAACHCGHAHRHEHGGTKHRPKGIPHLLKKFDMNKALFQIGEATVSVNEKGTAVVTELKTRERLVTRAAEAITVRQGKTVTEVVEKNGVDRNVPGYELAERFMGFFGNVLATMAGRSPSVHVKTIQTAASGPSLHRDEASDIIIQYIQ